MSKVTFTLIIFFVFLGKVTQVQATEDEFYRILEQAKLAGKNYISCLNNTANNTQVWERLEKIFIFEAYIDSDKQKKLAISRYITEEESEDLSEYAELREPCRELVIKEMEKAHPNYAMVFVKTFAESNAQIDKLLKKQITIGESNQQIIEMANRSKQRFTEVGRSLATSLVN